MPDSLTPTEAQAAIKPPSKSPGLRSGMLWTVVGQGTYSAAQWLMVVVLARSGGVTEVGTYSLGLALTAPVFLLLGFQLRSVQATDAQGQYQFGQYTTLRLISMALSLVITAGLALLYPQASGAIWWLGVGKAFEGISDVLYGLMQQRERLDWIAQGTMLRGVLGLVLLGVIFRLTHNMTLATAGIAVAAALTWFFLDRPRAARLAAEQGAGSWWLPVPLALFKLALPLGVVIALVSLGSNIPRLFIEHSLGRSALGVYSALAYVGVAGSVVVVALGTALTTRLSQYYAAGQRSAFIKLAAQLLVAAGLVGVALALAALWAGPQILHLLYGSVYAAQSDIFFWLNLAAGLGYLASCAGFAVTAARRFREQLPLYIVVTIALSLACWWLIPRYGLQGAAIAALIGAGVQLLGSMWLIASALKTIPSPQTLNFGEPHE